MATYNHDLPYTKWRKQFIDKAEAHATKLVPPSSTGPGPAGRTVDKWTEEEGDAWNLEFHGFMDKMHDKHAHKRAVVTITKDEYDRLRRG